ncbi:biotin/lipoyl-containing protein [candidate division CSSED10-310 bacterium]|uniref:Dihydrolipoamide acetyltransferase component of pyruvate dehydrogenase complex n=1 Tax=candidate division CSSED10-310 bacterium TaxID=2855610 RepID=A0ABV6Z1F9_UNCC1
MKNDVTVPALGESVNQGILVEWLKKDGDSVQVSEEIFELETDKATVSVPSQFAGILAILVPEGTEVTVGQVVGTIDSEVKTSSENADIKSLDQGTSVPTGPDTVPESPAMPVGPLSPAVQRIISEHDLKPENIAGSGKGGRITKADVLEHLDLSSVHKKTASLDSEAEHASRKSSPAETKEPSRMQETKILPPEATKTAAISATDQTGSRRRVKMSTLRQRIAQRLVQAQNEAAFLTTFNEINMAHVMTLRQHHKKLFEEKHGVKLGFMSFFVKACCLALASRPSITR